MRSIVTAVALAAILTTQAAAQPAPKAEPTQRALAQMVREAMEREATALAQVYALQDRVREMEAKAPEAPKQ